MRAAFQTKEEQPSSQPEDAKYERKRLTLDALNRVRSRNLIYPHVRRRRWLRERAKPVHTHAQHTRTARSRHAHTCKWPVIE